MCDPVPVPVVAQCARVRPLFIFGLSVHPGSSDSCRRWTERFAQNTTFTPAEYPTSLRLTYPPSCPNSPGDRADSFASQDCYGRQPAPRPPALRKAPATEGRHPNRFALSGWFTRLTCTSPVSLAGLNPHPTPAHSPSSLSRSMNEPIGRTSSTASHCLSPSSYSTKKGLLLNGSYCVIVPVYG